MLLQNMNFLFSVLKKSIRDLINKNDFHSIPIKFNFYIVLLKISDLRKVLRIKFNQNGLKIFGLIEKIRMLVLC